MSRRTQYLKSSTQLEYGIGYSLSVFVADTSSLRYRGLMQAFLSGPISTAFLNGPGWRWAYGAFAVLVPLVTFPLSGLFMWQFFTAKKLDLIPKNDSGRTTWQSNIYYCREFDAVGLILISTVVVFFLLPFNLYTIEAKGWGSSLIICFLVFGVVLIIAFAIWEKLFAPISFIPWSLLKDRTVFGACLLSFTLFVIVNSLSITESSYVMQTYTVGGVLLALVTGGVISFTGRYKPIALYFGVPVTILGTSLLIYFRQTDQKAGYIVMCMILISFAEGVLVICAEIAIMAAAAEQQYFASTLPKKLFANIPDIDQADLLLIYESLPMKFSFPPGTTERLAIQLAYRDSQEDY
ncbi:hypothetical protein BELL_1055g00010 [Botrytis elliptica]|uniref:Major facilitator superfamily (MFS) profile domain-containing protein n=1 Tax=Botrytis elliptica TaxID=278938 RepID=A0A4Z1J5E0_9HELO|nr:hypothetical protein BELL_1055g00010 [Botrytis elliptica]